MAIIRTMAARWSDADIAAQLNRMALRTGQGKTWTAHRVGSIRRVRDIPGYLSAEKNGEWLTMTEAAATLGVSNHTMRRLIKTRIVAAIQVVPDAPYQIRAADLRGDQVSAAIARKGRPCRTESESQLPLFPDT